MISGLVVLSEPAWGCYPFEESITSFLPVVDEVVVAFNVYGRDDGSKEKVKALGDKVRIVSTVFDIDKYGWISYGIARTMGYNACKGDVILMFDADGILHENDHGLLRENIEQFVKNPNMPTGYWEKYRFYQPTSYYDQHKHSGIYNKTILGDRFDFLHSNGKGIPNFSRLKPEESRSKGFPIYLFGYEHVWDTEEVFKHKVNRRGRMQDRQHGRPFKTPDEYFDEYIENLLRNFKLKHPRKTMGIEKQPKVIQKKLREVNETHFGHSFFGRWK